VKPRRSRLFSWVSAPESASLANFVIGTVILAALFGAGYLLSRDQPNGGLFLVVALICLGVAVIFAAVAGVEQLGTALLQRSGRTGREAAVAGLLAISWLMPWSVAIRLAHAAEVPGWKNPIAWVIVLAVGLPFLARNRRWIVPGLAVSGVALAGWLAWVAFQLTRPDFTALAFPFLPIDLLGMGWYAALAAWVVVVDALATGEDRDDLAPRPAAVWPFAVVPGLGLARLGLVARGRAWLVATVVLIVLIQADAYEPQQFAFSGAAGSLPDARWRLVPVAVGVALLVVYAASLWDTRRMIQRQRHQAPKLRILRGGSHEERLP
jgi:uncharacterized membrane protein YdcZ (DUF606 family)